MSSMVQMTSQVAIWVGLCSAMALIILKTLGEE
jgi:hypothetical protein